MGPLAAFDLVAFAVRHRTWLIPTAVTGLVFAGIVGLIAMFGHQHHEIAVAREQAAVAVDNSDARTIESTANQTVAARVVEHTRVVHEVEEHTNVVIRQIEADHSLLVLLPPDRVARLRGDDQFLCAHLPAASCAAGSGGRDPADGSDAGAGNPPLPALHPAGGAD